MRSVDDADGDIFRNADLAGEPVLLNKLRQFQRLFLDLTHCRNQPSRTSTRHVVQGRFPAAMKDIDSGILNA